MTATKFQPGDDTHLSLLMAPHSLNFVTGADHAALLAYGRDVFAAARDSKCFTLIEEPAPAQAVQTAPQIKLSAAVRGVGVVDDCDTALAVYFTAVPRKEDIRALHDALTKESSTQAAPALEAPDTPAQHQGMTIAGNGAAELGKLMREQRDSRMGVYPDGNPNSGRP